MTTPAVIRLLVIGTSLICLTVLAALGRVNAEAALAYFLAVFGYLSGRAANGVDTLAKIKKAVDAESASDPSPPPAI